MTNQNTLRYACEECGAELIIVKDSTGMLECCGEEMVLREYNKQENINISDEKNTKFKK